MADILRHYCLDCGYSLNALEERTCPECGRPFDPNDYATFRAGTRRPRRRVVLALALLVAIGAAVLLGVLWSL